MFLQAETAPPIGSGTWLISNNNNLSPSGRQEKFLRSRNFYYLWYENNLTFQSINWSINPNAAKSGGLQSQGAWGWSRSIILRTLSNAESEVLRLSRRGNNMAKSIPPVEFTYGGVKEMVIFLSITSPIIADHYLIFAILFMQLRGQFNPAIGHRNKAWHPNG